MKNQNNDFARGRNYIFNLIKFRQYSQKEIRDKLKAKGFEPEIIKETLDYFKKVKLVNDREFAEFWINTRMSKPLGFKAIQKELEQKGIPGAIIEELFSQKKPAFNEAETVQKIAEQRFSKLTARWPGGQSQKSLEKIKAQIYGYLMRRGFESDIIIAAINKVTLSS